MSFFKKKPVLILGGVIICSVLLAAVSHFGNGMPAKLAGAVITPAEKLLSKAAAPVARLRDKVMSAGDLSGENEELKAKVNELLIINRSVEEYIEENERLRELLRLRDEMTDKQVLAASVISADSDDFSYTVTINRGSADGISPEDAVVSTLGVVGRISELGEHWSRVTTLLSPQHALGVKVSRTGDLAVLEGDLKLAKDNQCRLGYITGSAELIEGDILVTSGYGGVYPPGLTVGKVVSVRLDNSGTIDYASVEPTADFSRLYEVLVITDWDRETVKADYVTGNAEEESPEAVSEPTTGEIAPEDIENAQG